MLLLETKRSGGAFRWIVNAAGEMGPHMQMRVEVGYEGLTADVGASGAGDRATRWAAWGGGAVARGGCGAHRAADGGQRARGDVGGGGAASSDAEVWRGRDNEGRLSRGGRTRDDRKF